MDILLPSTPLLLAFLGASLVLAVTPGPAVVYILTRTLAQGRASGLASVAGVALGNLGNAAGAALGLAALFAVSAMAFTVVKWLGALYLIFLGVRLWRQGDDTAVGAPQVRAQSHRRVFTDGFVVALLNPKTAIFFAAFLPQFMNPHGAVLPQSLLLGALFVAVAASTDLLYVLGASVLAPRLQRGIAQARWGRRIAGSSFIALGLLTALSERPRG
jgi:threonine/homoserine/homoserine lactone efflux protein